MAACDIDSIFKIIASVAAFIGIVYEFICWLKKRPDDTPLSPLQIIWAFAARVINHFAGSNFVSDELSFRRHVQKSTMSRITSVEQNKFSVDSLRLQSITHGKSIPRSAV